MKEASSGVGNSGVFAPKSPCGLGAVARAAASSGQGAGVAPYSEKSIGERTGRLPAANLGPVRPCSDCQGNEAQIHPDVPADLGSGTALTAALGVEIRGADVECHMPAGTAPSYGGEQDPGASGCLLLSCDGIDL
jgi:hypothetical protein